MLVEIRQPGEGELLRLTDGNKVRVEGAPEHHREGVDLHVITPTGTVVVTLEAEEAAKLAVTILRERSLVVNGHG